MVGDGFMKIVDGLATFSDIWLQREVVKIQHGAHEVTVHTKGGGAYAYMIMSTALAIATLSLSLSLLLCL